MKLGLGLIQTAFSANPTFDLEVVRQAETLGFHSAWAAEAYGCDAVTGATWLAAHTTTLKVGTAIMQIPARSPASAAMTAIGLDALSGAASCWVWGVPARRFRRAGMASPMTSLLCAHGNMWPLSARYWSEKRR